MKNIPQLRIILALLIGVLACAVTFALVGAMGASPQPDLWQPWYAANSILLLSDPYALVGPERPVFHLFPFVYPLTAGVVLLPFGFLPIHSASAVFAGISSGLLAYALSRDGWHGQLVFLSVPFASALWGVQWSPVFTAAVLLPGLSFLYVAKPSTGLAMLMANGSAKAFRVAGTGALLALMVSLMIVPGWPGKWIEALRQAPPLSIPLLGPVGLVAPFALLRWRLPEARAIAFLACVPQTALWYEVLPLFLAAKTFRQSLVLLVSTSLPLFTEVLTSSGDVRIYPTQWELALLAYLPAVLMVVTRKSDAAGNRQ